MPTMQELSQSLKALNQRPISYYKCYAKIMGSVAGGVALSQLMFYYAYADGNIFVKKDEDLRDATGLSIRELREAKLQLKKLPFVSIQVRGIPPVTFYKIDEEALWHTLGTFPNLNDVVQIKTNEGVQINSHNVVQNIKRDSKKNIREIYPPIVPVGEQSLFSAIETLKTLIGSIPLDASRNAKSFHESLYQALVDEGWWCQKEYWVKDRGDGKRGRIDIVVTAPVTMAIEIDRKSPRKKSVVKIDGFSGVRVVVLRSGEDVAGCDGYDAVLSYPRLCPGYTDMAAEEDTQELFANGGEVIAASQPGKEGYQGSAAVSGKDVVEWAEGDSNSPQPLLTSFPETPGKSKRARNMDEPSQEVLAYLNLVAQRHYEVPGEITVRLSQGVTVEECKLVIDYLAATRSKEWKRDWFDQVAPFRKVNFDRNLAKAKAWRPDTRKILPSPLPPAALMVPPGDRADRLARMNATLQERTPYAPR